MTVDLNKIKAVAIDLDGTLLAPDREATPATVSAVQRLKEIGVKPVICTGRPLQGVIDLVHKLNLLAPDDLIITYNGGLIQRPASGEVLKKVTLSLDDLSSLLKLAEAINMPLAVVDATNAYLLNEPLGRQSGYPKIMTKLPFSHVSLSDFSTSHQFNKVLFSYDVDVLNAAIKEIPKDYYDRFTIMKSRPNLLELLPKTVNKGHAISDLASILEVPVSAIMAIGDQENDLPMIKKAGIGVAMGNAIPEVKAVADMVTTTNAEDGVAKVFEQLISARKHQI